jgi:hypothetical protein
VLPKKYLVLAMLVAQLSVAIAAAGDARFTPAPGTVTGIEGKVTLPKGAGPLSSYTRYYAGAVVDGRRKIQAFYERGKSEVHILAPSQELPGVLDGGCDFIEFTYDIAADRIEQIMCHGVAMSLRKEMYLAA